MDPHRQPARKPHEDILAAPVDFPDRASGGERFDGAGVECSRDPRRSMRAETIRAPDAWRRSLRQTASTSGSSGIGHC
jgi:hypothetical protein